MALHQFKAKRHVAASKRTWRNEPRTDAQKEYLAELLEDRKGNPEAEKIRDELNVYVAEKRTITKGVASDMITALKEIPKAPPPEQSKIAQKLEDHEAGEDVLEAMGAKRAGPKGKFALGEEPHIKFYQVDRPTKGKWSGYIFVKLLIGSPGNWERQRLPKARQDEILKAIMKDPCAAQAKFGFHFVCCGRCDSPLSKPNSRAAGYGEICAGHMGWHYPGDKEAYAILLARYGEEKTSEIYAEATKAATKPQDASRWAAYVSDPYKPLIPECYR